MTDLVIQRVVFPLDYGVSSLYYRMLGNPHPAAYCDPAPAGRRSIVLGRGASIDTNTYFNSFFEAYWRRHTTLTRLLLRVRLSGAGTIRLWRASTACGASEVGRVEFDGNNQTIEMEVPGPRAHYREFGTLFFEVVARSRCLTIASADWMAKDVEPKPVRLVAGYCTFDREAFILNNIRALAGDTDLADRLSQIVVVDQGTRKLKSHLDYGALPRQVASKVFLVEQANFGGSGGFTRCILEARRRHDATHFLLLDDDAIVEPESVFRTAAFFSLGKEEIALGGPMLDLLRPTEMYEAGGFVVPAAMGVNGRGRNLSLDVPQNVQALSDLQYSHYSAWWFFACPFSAVERVGLPLPLFIRGDDLEYGCRLMKAGIPTLTLPGLGVWHVPFYLKQRGWEDYYSHRNMLAAIALHFPVSRITLVCTFLRILLHRLLTLDYFKAWALCRGMDDYLAGPSILQENPERMHRQVLEVHRKLSAAALPKTNYLPTIPAPPVPGSPLRQLASLLGTLLWQLVHPTPGKHVNASGALKAKDEHWYALGKADVVAVDDPYCDAYLVLRRDRGKFLGLLARGLRSALRLLFTHGQTIRRWQTEAKQLSGTQFWYKYLGITIAETPEVGSVHDADVSPHFAPLGEICRQGATAGLSSSDERNLLSHT
jgi:galactofuranosylgalactofuranosylrhamnosyl-N-acetylglucosaminyl-diphospho-decaprenol beta-1,5/1,6-galactofuranosyltransferase